MKAEEEFWNNPATVTTFRSLSPPKYWIAAFKKIKNPQRFKALDLGCGGGRNTELLVKLGFSTWSCDLYAQMVKATRERISKLIGAREARKMILKASMLHLPFKEEFFDIVLSNGVYHNAKSFKEFRRAIQETARVLKKGGLLYLNIFYKGIMPHNARKVHNQRGAYQTEQGLYMVLLPAHRIITLLKENGLRARGGIKKYESGVLTGKRSVLRGVFYKIKRRG